MAGSYKAEAIILKRQNWGEADRLITVFSRDQGKLRLIAKGVRRLNSRKKGHLELFTRARLLVVKGRNIDLVTEAMTVNHFPCLRQNLNRVRIAYLLLELVDKLTAENQEHEEVFGLLCETLSLLNRDFAPKNLIADFEAKLLQVLGFGLPARLDRASLEAHILDITEQPLGAKKLKLTC